MSVVALWDSDLVHGLRRSPSALAAAVLVLVLVIAAFAAPWLAPYDAFDPARANVVDARLAPGSMGMFGDRYWLGTDPQGRDMLSAMMFGLRTSLIVGLGAVALAASVGIALGLVAGWAGGWVDAVIMRAADVQLSFPAILIALLVDGIARTALGRASHDSLAIPLLILAIAASYWVQYARTVRGLVLVERGRAYVLAARITGVGAARIVLTHVAPNVLRPVVAVATINLALAIVAEATLSFLGVGIPPTQPSLGTLVRTGGEYLFSGDWWMALLPGGVLLALSLAVNVLGDWLRDVFAAETA